MFGDFYDDDNAGYCNALEMMAFGSKDLAEEATALLELERGGGRRQPNNRQHQQHRRSRDDDDDDNNNSKTRAPTGGAAEASPTHPCARATSVGDQNPDGDEARATQCLLSTVSEMGGPQQIAVRISTACDEWRKKLCPILGGGKHKKDSFYRDVRRKAIESGALVRVTVQGQECYKLSGWATSEEFTNFFTPGITGKCAAHSARVREKIAERKDAVQEAGLEPGSSYMCTSAGCKMVFTSWGPCLKHVQEVHGGRPNCKESRDLFRQSVRQNLL